MYYCFNVIIGIYLLKLQTFWHQIIYAIIAIIRVHYINIGSLYFCEKF